MSRVNDDGKAQDLHFKMSKKIAQLTKVIYQLNCRNEDGDAYVRSVADRYEDEIGAIMGDARTKISLLRDELAAKNDTKKLESVVKELSRQHDKEKEVAMKELDSLKRSLVDKETEAKKNFEERMLSAAREVAKAKEDFNGALADIRSANSNSASELDAFRKRKDEEADALVKEYNERYKAMLAQQMDEQDQLEKKLNTEWSARFEALQADMKNKVADLTKAVNEERSTCQQLEAALRSSKAEADQLRRTVADLEADIATRSARESGLSQGTDALSKDLASALAQLRTAESERASLSTRLADSEKVVVDLQAEVANLTERIARLVTDCTDKDNNISALTARSTNLEEQLDQLRKEMGQVSASGCDAQKTLQQKVRDLSDELAGEKSGHFRTQGDLVTERESTAALAKELESTKAQWEKEVTALKRVFADERNAAASNASGDVAALQSKHNATIAELRLSLQADFDKEVSQLKAAHQREQAALEAKHNAAAKEAASKLSVMQSTVDDLKMTIKQLEDARDKLSSQMTGETGALQRDLESTQQFLNQVRDELAAKIAEHALAMERLSAEWGVKLKRELDAAKSDFDAQYAEAAKVYEGRLKEADERHQLVKVDLEAAISDLERTLSQLKRSHSEEMDLLRKQHAIALDGALSAQGKDAIAQREAANAKLRAELQAKYDAERQTMVAAHKDAVAALSKQLAEEKLARVAEKRLLEEQLARLTASSSEASSGLESRLRDAEAELLKQQQGHRIELQQTESRLTDKMAATESALNSKYDSAMREWEGKLSSLKSSYQTKLDEVGADARAAQRDMDESYKNRIASLEKRKDDERNKALSELTASFEDKLAKLNAHAKTEINDLQNANRTLTNEVRALSAQERDLTKQLDTTTGLYNAEQGKVAQGVIDREAQSKRHQQELNELKLTLEHERNSAIAVAHAQHAQEVEGMKQEFESERSQFSSKIKQLKRTIGDLEYKYANRESRAEDVEKINNLLKDLREKDEALLKAFNDMKFYKLELVNREESYNKVFGRQPTLAGGAAADGGRTVAPSSAPAKGHPATDTNARARVKSLK